MRPLVLGAHRIRIPLYYGCTIALVAGVLLPSWLPEGRAKGAITALATAGFVGLLLTVLVIVVGGRLLPRPSTVTVTAPVTGRWLALNSPATKEPSHGVHAYGQAFAIDLVHEPEDGARPTFGSGAGMRPPHHYPAFGQPVSAMMDGKVVAVVDRLRDHRSRSSFPAILYMTLEGMVRELGGPRFVVGNHVTILAPDGSHALVAHLRRGSARVAIGDKVRAGDLVGECGNSGNSSEPHVHAQIMDRASLWTARGIPMTFSGIDIDGHPSDRLPRDEEHLVA